MLSYIETKYISYIRPEYLYNFKFIATSVLGYKHNLKAIQKVVDRFKKYKPLYVGKISKQKRIYGYRIKVKVIRCMVKNIKWVVKS
jgi:hypothetical protein